MSNTDGSFVRSIDKRNGMELEVTRMNNLSTSSGKVNKTSNVASAFASSTREKNERPNFRKLHEEYKVSWRNNHPKDETRPMRLMEFIFSKCDENNDDFSDDTFDKDLKKITEKRGRRTRDVIAKINSRYEIRRKERSEYFDSL